LLACLATKSAAEAGTPPNLYGGQLSFKRIGPDGPVWIFGEFENKPGSVRIAFRRFSLNMQEPNPDNPFFIAMHEAGHAASAAVYGFPFTGVDVILRRRDNGRISAGTTHVENLNPTDVVGKGEATLPRLIQCMAGPCAEELVNPHAFRQSAADHDRAHILQIARYAIAGRMENDQPQPILPEEMAANEPQIRALITKAEAEGRQFAKRYEKAIRKIAAALQALTSLSSDEVQAIVDECRVAGEVS
jgi:ATP-dependent Zn protease